jgi:uncharacterized protein (DUF433 family)
MSGLPRIRDTWVTVSAVLGQLAAGRSTDEVLSDYPYLESADILVALEFAVATVFRLGVPVLLRAGAVMHRLERAPGQEVRPAARARNVILGNEIVAIVQQPAQGYSTEMIM